MARSGADSRLIRAVWRIGKMHAPTHSRNAPVTSIAAFQAGSTAM